MDSPAKQRGVLGGLERRRGVRRAGERERERGEKEGKGEIVGWFMFELSDHDMTLIAHLVGLIICNQGGGI